MDGTAALSRSFALFYVCFTSKPFAGVSLSYSSPKTHKDASSPPAAETTVLQRRGLSGWQEKREENLRQVLPLFWGFFFFNFLSILANEYD